MEINKIKLIAFLDERPALTNRALAKEAGISEVTIRRIKSGESEITPRTSEKLLPVLKKYGYGK